MNRFYNMKCINCGKIGHSYKVCREPKISYGIMAIKCPNPEIQNIVKTFLSSIYETFEQQTITYTHESILEFFSKIKDNIKLLMVMRKHTLGYMEFIRGHYNIKNISLLSYLFQQMTPAEIKLINEHINDFDFLWKDMWSINNIHNAVPEIQNDAAIEIQKQTIENKESEHKKSVMKCISHNEYEASKINFYKLQSNEHQLQLNDFLQNTKTVYHSPEWGLPKGRRAHNESDLECAEREFTEETGFRKDDYILFQNIKPFEENLTGFNGMKYRHIYYIALLTTDVEPSYNNLGRTQKCEIGDIGLYNFDEIMNKLRPHHTDRKTIVINVLMNIIKYVLADIINKFLSSQSK
jgi:8-oxo-dGTP pyrophosphatase MutT (NUDIX family)